MTLISMNFPLLIDHVINDNLQYYFLFGTHGMWQKFIRCAHYIYMPILFIGFAIASS
jgi:hypothetical protein